MSTDTGELFELEEEPRPSASAEPRPAALATWIARVIVVLTLGLLTLVGGLFLGLSVWDTPSSATPMSTTMPTTPQTSLSGTPVPTETDAAATQAPPVRISSVAPGGSTSASGSRRRRRRPRRRAVGDRRSPPSLADTRRLTTRDRE